MKALTPLRAVYVLKITGTQIYKVGCTSRSANERIRQLSVEVCKPVEFVDAVLVRDGFAVEKKIHRLLAPMLHHGREWFLLKPDEVSSLTCKLHSEGEVASACEPIGYVMSLRTTPEVIVYLDELVRELDCKHPSKKHTREDAAHRVLSMWMRKRDRNSIARQRRRIQREASN